MKKYKCLLIIFFGLIIWNSCKESSENFIFQVQHIDNIKCSNVYADAGQIFCKIDTSEDSYFAYLNPLSDSVGIHEINKNINITIPIPARNFIKASSSTSQFYIYSRDSIFWFNPYLFEVYIFNCEGEVLRKFSTGTKYLPAPSVRKSFLFSKNLFYSWFPHVNLTTSKQRKLVTNKILPVCELNINHNNDSLQFSTFGNFPDTYLEGKFYMNITPLLCCGKDNELILSYESDHNIYIYQNKNLLGKKNCKSNFIDDFNEVPDNLFNDKSFTRAYQGREARYKDFIYDPFRAQYYRITQLEMGPHTNMQTAKWTIIIMDTSFNVVGEVTLPYLLYMPDFIIPASEGIYIKKTPANEKEFKGELILSLVRFIK